MATKQNPPQHGGEPPDDLTPGTRPPNEGGRPPSQPRHITSMPPTPILISHAGPVDVNLQSIGGSPTDVQAFWQRILVETEDLGFARYAAYISRVFCGERKGDEEQLLRYTTRNPYFGVDAYQMLKVATEAFLIATCGWEAFPEDGDPGRFNGRSISKDQFRTMLEKYLLDTNGNLPYLHNIVGALEIEDSLPFCHDGIAEQLLKPCLLELIWSYWHEEGMLVQAINAISLRFQNKRGPADREPLANFETHPLRPLSNLLWGYIQDEDHRLTIARRAYEYEHQYGLTIVGKAVPRLRPADRRSKFLEAFHRLLHDAAVFYDRSANLTVRADAFPLLNTLREVHLLLAEGAHNQFRDLTWTARGEMLIQQWLLSRGEMQEFLRGRQSVPFAEPWMGTVDSLKRLMGWSDTPVTHFHDLAVRGERILLSIRYHNWNDATSEDEARGWAAFFRSEIQRYIHAYQAVTGVDLGVTSDAAGRPINATLPSVLLQNRTARQNR